eukprot:3314103-Amphidinium_carterae.1
MACRGEEARLRSCFPVLPTGGTYRQDRAWYCQASGKPRRLRGVSQVGDPLRTEDVGPIIDHDLKFGSDESQMLDKIASWERHIEEHERISGEKIADSVKCAVIQKGMPSALRTYFLVNSPNASDWTAMRRSIQSYLLATASAPRPVQMDLGYLPWSNKLRAKERVTKTAGGT